MDKFQVIVLQPVSQAQIAVRELCDISDKVALILSGVGKAMDGVKVAHGPSSRSHGRPGRGVTAVDLGAVVFREESQPKTCTWLHEACQSVEPALLVHRVDQPGVGDGTAPRLHVLGLLQFSHYPAFYSSRARLVLIGDLLTSRSEKSTCFLLREINSVFWPMWT